MADLGMFISHLILLMTTCFYNVRHTHGKSHSCGSCNLYTQWYQNSDLKYDCYVVTQRLMKLSFTPKLKMAIKITIK